MFSVQQKRDISDAVQKILRATNHPELPVTGEISFDLHVNGAEGWSWADIKNNGAVGDPGVNPHNELMASVPEEEGRDLIKRAEEVAQHTDPRASPEEFYREMLDKTYTSLETRLTRLETFFKEIIEDNLIQHHSHQIENLATAIRQLGSPKITGGD